MMEKIAVERSIWIAAPPEQVWGAVTQPGHLDRWYAAHYRWHIPDLKVGTSVRFYNPDDEADVQIAIIEVMDPPRQFTLRWMPNASYPSVSLVTSFLLKEENGGTRATISESGYENVPDQERQDWLDATGGGYTMSIDNLKAYVEGRSLPH